MRTLRAVGISLGAALIGVCVGLLMAGMLLRVAQGQAGNRGTAARSGTALIPSGLDREIRRVEADVDRIEQQALGEWHALPINTSTRMDQVRILGKLLLFDKSLSVNRNEACSFCHMPDTDFTGPISILNQTTVAYPGSVRHRFGHRKPQSYTYAPFYPVLQYNQTQQDFYGGNFGACAPPDTGSKIRQPSRRKTRL